jgi:hypothetical protein
MFIPINYIRSVQFVGNRFIVFTLFSLGFPIPGHFQISLSGPGIKTVAQPWTRDGRRDVRVSQNQIRKQTGNNDTDQHGVTYETSYNTYYNHTCGTYAVTYAIFGLKDSNVW